MAFQRRARAQRLRGGSDDDVCDASLQQPRGVEVSRCNVNEPDGSPLQLMDGRDERERGREGGKQINIKLTERERD